MLILLDCAVDNACRSGNRSERIMSSRHGHTMLSLYLVNLHSTFLPRDRDTAVIVCAKVSLGSSAICHARHLRLAACISLVRDVGGAGPS